MKQSEAITAFITGQIHSRVKIHTSAILMLGLNGEFTIKEYAKQYKIGVEPASLHLKAAFNGKLIKQRQSNVKAANNKYIKQYRLSPKGWKMAELILSEFKK